jgi:hypothetical protein
MTGRDPIPAFDPELWVVAEGFEGRCYLLGNNHTHLGRMAAWIESLGLVAGLSKYQITDASEAARRWIDGYLHGSEPGPAEYLGIGDGAITQLDEDDPGMNRWRAALTEFHETGSMRSLPPVPTIPLRLPDIGGHDPWVWAGGQVWVWKDGSWHPAQPQPHLEGAFLAGSICATRGHHELTVVGDRHATCVDCGETSEIIG